MQGLWEYEDVSVSDSDTSDTSTSVAVVVPPVVRRPPVVISTPPRSPSPSLRAPPAPVPAAAYTGNYVSPVATRQQARNSSAPPPPPLPMNPPEEDQELMWNARFVGLHNARLQREIRRESRSGKYKRIRQEPEWHALGYGTFQEELKYGSSLDPRLVRKAAVVAGNDGVEVYIFYGKHLKFMPEFIGNEGVWNPNTTHRADWNMFRNLIDAWEDMKAMGRVWHEDGGDQCVLRDCNCFVNGKHVSGYDIVYVPASKFANRSSSLWFYDELEHAPVVVQPKTPWRPLFFKPERKMTNEELFAQHEFEESALAKHRLGQCVSTMCFHCACGTPQDGVDLRKGRREKLLEKSLERLERQNMRDEDANVH